MEQPNWRGIKGDEPPGFDSLLLRSQPLDQMIRIEGIAIDAEPVRAFAEAWQNAQPLNRGLGLGFGRIDPDKLDLVPVVVALVFVMNHKDRSKRLVQSPSPIRPKTDAHSSRPCLNGG